MKISDKYGKLVSRTFVLTRYEVEQIVRDHISAKAFSIPVPVGAHETASTPFFWREDWNEDDDSKFLVVCQEFATDVVSDRT